MVMIFIVMMRMLNVFRVPEKFRVTSQIFWQCYSSIEEAGNNGEFEIRRVKSNDVLAIIASDGLGWEHVSVRVKGRKRCPNWGEMCYVKDLFWGRDDLVIQYHPTAESYVNCHPYVLHLWRKLGTNDFCETPLKIMI
jgi:hypothetical protein